jgi:creatinine amidohydrolase
MRITDMHWQQVEEYLRHDDRAVVPLGCTEQHAYLSLSTDSILAERVAVEAAEPLGVPVFPVLAYGITPYFRGFPGTVSLRVETYLRIIKDLLDGLTGQGFRRIVLVNGHGGNSAARALVGEWLADHPGPQVRWHDWWSGPAVWDVVEAIDPLASHASWMENFPWTRLPGVDMPDAQKPAVDMQFLGIAGASVYRAGLGDGNFAGRYQRSDIDMRLVWETGVKEVRAQIEGPWHSVENRE